MRKYTEEEVIAMIRDGQGDLSLRAYASKLGITPAYLSDIFFGRRSPGKTILDHFNLTKKRQIIVTYERSK